jgi:hypothetical protein
MIFLEKRAHLISKVSFEVVCLLRVNVFNQRTQIRWTDGKQTVTALPCEVASSLLVHPCGRTRFDLRHDSRCGLCRSQPHRKMDMVSDSANSEAFAIEFARRSCNISVKPGKNTLVDQRSTMFRAEDHVHQVETQRLWHRTNYMPGLQPSPVLADTYLGLRPRLVCRRTFSPSPRAARRGHHRIATRELALPEGTASAVPQQHQKEAGL